MACCIFIAWAFRLLVVRPVRAILRRDLAVGDAYETAPQGIRWEGVRNEMRPAGDSTRRDESTHRRRAARLETGKEATSRACLSTQPL